MKSYKKITNKVLILFLILIVLTGCQQVANNQEEVKDEFEKIVIFFREKEIEILNETDLININMIISNMQPEKRGEVKIEGIKGKIFLKSGIINDFAIMIDKVYIGNNIYQGENECKQVRNILNRYIYDKRYIIEALESEDKITVVAKDLENEIMLDNKNKIELIDVFTKSDVKYNDNYPGGALVSKFPNYNIELSDFNIHIINPNTLIVVKDYYDIYLTDNGIWNLLNEIIPIQNIKDEKNILYLFNAKKVEINRLPKSILDGDYTSRKEWIIRILREAKLKENTIIDNPKLMIKFTIEGKTYEVSVYEHSFKYNSKYYEKLNILKEIESMLSAG